MAESSVVLSGFAPVQLQKPVPQEHLLSYYAWLMASARCAAEGADTAEAAGKILADVQHKVRRYGVSPSFITRRQFNAFPDSEEALGQAGTPPALPEGFEDLLANPDGPSVDFRMQRFGEGLRIGPLKSRHPIYDALGQSTHRRNDRRHSECLGFRKRNAEGLALVSEIEHHA